jgi:hypothetical protein
MIPAQFDARDDEVKCRHAYWIETIALSLCRPWVLPTVVLYTTTKCDESLAR